MAIELRKTSDNSLLYTFAEIDGTFSGDLKSIFLTGFPPLEYETDYKLTIANTDVEDLAGNAFAGATIFFETKTNPAQPAIINTVPFDGEEDVSVNPVFELTFTENIFLGSNLPQLYEGAFHIHTFTAGEITINGNIATFVYGDQLNISEAHHLEIYTDSFQDSQGQDLDMNYTINFTTSDDPDSQPPTIVIQLPVIGDINVDLDDIISITFDEGVQLGIGDIELRTVIGDTLVYTYAGGDIGFSNANQTLTFSGATLMAGVEYNIVIPAGAIEDIGGNPFVGIAAGEWTFTTIPEV